MQSSEQRLSLPTAISLNPPNKKFNQNPPCSFVNATHRQMDPPPLHMFTLCYKHLKAGEIYITANVIFHKTKRRNSIVV
jgi:hypothetical protein